MSKNQNVENVKNSNVSKSKVSVENVATFATMSRENKKKYTDFSKVTKQENNTDIQSISFWCKFIAEKYISNDNNYRLLIDIRLDLKKKFSGTREELKNQLLFLVMDGVPFKTENNIIAVPEKIVTEISKTEMKVEYKFKAKGKTSFSFVHDAIFTPRKQKIVILDVVNNEFTKTSTITVTSDKVK